MCASGGGGSNICTPKHQSMLYRCIAQQQPNILYDYNMIATAVATAAAAIAAAMDA